MARKLPLAVNWALRLTGAVVIVALVKARFGTSACLFAMIALAVGGFLPPAFPMLYRAYTTRAIGYRARHVLHPRLPSHSTTIHGVRRIVPPAASRQSNSSDSGLLIVPVPVLADNYAYLVICERTRRCLAIDPADPHRVLAVVKALGVRLTHVFTTHKHWDHAGGNDELAALCPGLVFVGSAIDRPAATSHFVRDGARCTVGSTIEVQVIETPGHTTGHIMFRVSAINSAPAEQREKDNVDCDGKVPPLAVSLSTLRRVPELHSANERDAEPAPSNASGPADSIPSASPPGTSALFTGDCIFCGGCGAMFECRAATDVLRTYDALQRLCAEQPNMLVYVGHEYSARLYSELVRQRSGADMTDAIRNRANDIAAARRTHRCTVPSTMQQEAHSNPLMTVQRSVLEQLARQDADSGMVEQQIYISKLRIH